jgi:hypothetical protein
MTYYLYRVLCLFPIRTEYLERFVILFIDCIVTPYHIFIPGEGFLIRLHLNIAESAEEINAWEDNAVRDLKEYYGDK